ncbi:hypothetical protein RUND412_006941, partial [Rhizina undulata]
MSTVDVETGGRSSGGNPTAVMRGNPNGDPTLLALKKQIDSVSKGIEGNEKDNKELESLLDTIDGPSKTKDSKPTVLSRGSTTYKAYFPVVASTAKAPTNTAPATNSARKAGGPPFYIVSSPQPTLTLAPRTPRAAAVLRTKVSAASLPSTRNTPNTPLKPLLLSQSSSNLLACTPKLSRPASVVLLKKKSFNIQLPESASGSAQALNTSNVEKTPRLVVKSLASQPTITASASKQSPRIRVLLPGGSPKVVKPSAPQVTESTSNNRRISLITMVRAQSSKSNLKIAAPNPPLKLPPLNGNGRSNLASVSPLTQNDLKPLSGASIAQNNLQAYANLSSNPEPSRQKPTINNRIFRVPPPNSGDAPKIKKVKVNSNVGIPSSPSPAENAKKPGPISKPLDPKATTFHAAKSGAGMNNSNNSNLPLTPIYKATNNKTNEGAIFTPINWMGPGIPEPPQVQKYFLSPSSPQASNSKNSRNPFRASVPVTPSKPATNASGSGSSSKKPTPSSSKTQTAPKASPQSFPLFAPIPSSPNFSHPSPSKTPAFASLSPPKTKTLVARPPPPPVPVVKDPEEDLFKLECVSCMDSYIVDVMVQSPNCMHFYCKKCLKMMFLPQLSLASGAAFVPVKCCRSMLPPSLLEGELSKAQIAKYDQLLLEYDTMDKVYCYFPQCAEFIAPSRIKGDGQAICKKCSRITCRYCKKQSHQGLCKEDKETSKVLEDGKKKGWQQCPSCKHLVEKTEGCL